MTNDQENGGESTPAPWVKISTIVLVSLFALAIAVYVGWSAARPSRSDPAHSGHAGPADKPVQAELPYIAGNDSSIAAPPSAAPTGGSASIGFELPRLSGFFRLDGRDGKVDREMRAPMPSHLKNLAVYGNETQLGDALKGVTPALDRTIGIFVFSDSDLQIISLSEFEDYKRSIESEAGNISNDTKARLAEGETANNALIKERLGADHDFKVSAVENLGVFDNSPNSISFSVLSRSDFTEPGKPKGPTVIASSFCAVHLVTGQVVILTSQAVYSKPEDLIWTKTKVTDAKAALLAGNSGTR